MDDHLQQFKNLSRELREAVSSEEKIKALEEIEAKYNLKLTKLVVRVMIKDIAWSELEKFFQENFYLSPEKAAELKKDLAEKIFNEVINYLEKPTYEIIPPQRDPALAAAKKYLPAQAGENTKTEKTATTETQKPAFVETTAGEAEIDFKKIAQEARDILATVALGASSALLDIEKIIKEIKQKLNLVFEDEVLEHRFENIVRSYFKEVRNEVQTEEALCRAKKIGGLEFPPEKAALVIRVIKEFKNKIELGIRNKELGINNQGGKETIQSQKIATAETQKPASVEAAPFAPLSGATKAESAGKQIEIDRNKQPSVETLPPVAAKLAETKKLPTEEVKPVDRELQKRFESGPILPAFKRIEKPVITKAQKIATTEPQNISESRKNSELRRLQGKISIQIKQPISGEKLVEDIHQGAPRAIGPVEELAEITPLDLQRWGGGENTTQIILDKINLLKEISLAKKAEGIHAWQRSSLAKLYLEIGREALENKKSILQTIRERENEGSPFLEIEDFEAINELNQKLRF